MNGLFARLNAVFAEDPTTLIGWLRRKLRRRKEKFARRIQRFKEKFHRRFQQRKDKLLYRFQRRREKLVYRFRRHKEGLLYRVHEINDKLRRWAQRREEKFSQALRRHKVKLLRRTLRLILALGWTSLPPGLRTSDFLSMGLASRLQRLAEMGDAKQFFRARDLLLRCAPASFLLISEDRLEDCLECLAAFHERDLIQMIADCYVAASPRDLHPRRPLLIAAACVAINDEKRANWLLSSFVLECLAKDSRDRLAGVYPVRMLLPPHWHRQEESGLVTFLDPGEMGRPPTNSVTLPLPFQDCATVERAQVVGEFNIFDDQGRLLVYDHAGHPRLPRVAGLRLEVRGTAHAMDRAAIYLPYNRRERLPAAIHLAGRCAPNYFHWMIEYLPRLLTAIEGGADEGASLIIPAGLPTSMRCALDIVNEGRFPLYEFAPGVLLNVDRLFVPSMHSCVVDGGALPLSRIGALSPRHLRFVRERVLRHVQGAGRDPTPPRKVFLLRGGRGRSIRAEQEIREALAAEGFTALDPAQLEFEDQVRMFRDAEVIVAASGAALTNLLFCDNKPDVLALIGVQNIDFNLFSNILQVTGGGRYFQVPGRPLMKAHKAVNEEQYIHADYEVPVNDVMEALRRTQGKT